MSRLWNLNRRQSGFSVTRGSLVDRLKSKVSLGTRSGWFRLGHDDGPGSHLRRSLSMEPLEHRVLLASDAVYSLVPSPDPLVMAPDSTSGEMVVNVVNDSGSSGVVDGLFAWSTVLRIEPDPLATGTLTFNSFGLPADYLLGGVPTFGITFSSIDDGGAQLTAFETMFTPPGVQVPVDPGAGLVKFDFSASADADGTFNIVAITGTGWTDSAISDVAFANGSGTIATVEVEGGADADLEIAKSGAPDPVVAGEELTYTIEVTNNGPDDAEDVTVADSLPTGVTLVSTSGCAEDPVGVPDCSLGTIASGESKQYTVTVAVDPDVADGTVLTNAVLVSSTTPDPDEGNNAAIAQNTVAAVADLALEKLDDPNPVLAGETLTYTLNVTNSGPSDAHNVVVADTLPAGVSLVETVGCAEDPNGVPTCNLGTIAVGQTKQVTMTVAVDSSVDDGSILTNEAAVSFDGTDPNEADNTASVTTTVLAVADISIDKDDLPDPVLAGDVLTYTVTVANAGPSDARNVVVTDVLPPGVTLISTNGADEDPNAVPTATLGTIPAGQSKQYTIIVQLDSDLAAGTILDNVASVTTTTNDPDGTNNTTNEETTVETAADLQIQKTDSTDPVVAGTQLVYTVTVTNDGPSDAEGVVVTDTLPAGVTFVSTAGAAEDPNGVPTATLGTIVAGQSKQYTITVDIPADTPEGTVLANQAEVTATTPDPVAENNVVTEETTVDAVADIWITKTADPDPVPVGGQLTYTLTVTNDGPSDAQEVSVTDLIPAGLIQVTTTGCAEDPTGTPLCNLGLIPTGQTKQFTITATVADELPDGTTLLNQATAFSETSDPDSNNNTTDITTLVVGQADLSITKIDSPDPVAAGDPLTYTVTVTNAGPSNASGVTVTDTLPAGVTFVSTAGCDQDPLGVPTCDLGSILPTQSKQFVITVDVDLETLGDITNLVEVTALTPDPDTSNNSATEVTRVNPPAAPEADLSITKADAPDPVLAGEQLTYTVEVTNNGPDAAQNVVVTDALPAGVTFVSTNGCAEDPNGVPTCSLGTMQPGETLQYTITVNVDSSVLGATLLTNTVNVQSDTTDPNVENNTATAETTVNALADLSIEKTDDPDPVNAGNQLTYTVTVANAGPSDAQNVVVTDSLPAGVTFVSTTGCAEDPNGVPTCSLGTIVAGQSAQYTITVEVDAETLGTITNEAAVDSDTSDPDAVNNVTTEDTEVLPPVIPEADLSIDKTDDPDPVVAGNQLVYTITVANAGPDDAQNVVVTDTLPAGVTFVSTNGCAEDPNGVPTCSLGTITAGQSKQYTITVDVDPETIGVITNDATVASDTVDPDESNNSVSEDTMVEGIGTPPTVVDVLISGQEWNIAPFSLVTGHDPNIPLPWVNLDTIDVIFDQDVEVEMISLTLVGVNVPLYTPDGFSYDGTTNTATWTFDTALGTDKLLLNLAGEAGDLSPIDSNPGPGGLLLNGGSDFEVRFNVLIGDVTGNGATTVTDLVNVGTRVATATPDDYIPRFDVNGNGQLTIADLAIVATQIPSVLPDGEPTLPSLDALFADIDELIDEIVDPL